MASLFLPWWDHDVGAKCHMSLAPNHSHWLREADHSGLHWETLRDLHNQVSGRNHYIICKSCDKGCRAQGASILIEGSSIEHECWSILGGLFERWSLLWFELIYFVESWSIFFELTFNLFMKITDYECVDCCRNALRYTRLPGTSCPLPSIPSTLPWLLKTSMHGWPATDIHIRTPFLFPSILPSILRFQVWRSCSAHLDCSTIHSQQGKTS